MSSALDWSIVRGERAGLEDASARAASPQIPTQPLPGCLRRDALAKTSLGGVQAMNGHLFNHLKSAGEGKSGMLMGVDPVGCPE
jgi:hypothetical protein